MKKAIAAIISFFIMLSLSACLRQEQELSDITALDCGGYTDGAMLYREINVTDIPEGLQSEYEWNNASTEMGIEEFSPMPEDDMEGNSSQEDSADPPPVIEESPYEGSGQLPEEITKQIEIYVNEREVWLPEPWKFMPRYYYAWSDLNQDGSLELICSYYEGTGWYSRSYVYAINSDGGVECVAKLDREDAPDLLWGLELYADTQEGQDPRHFYIRTGDVTKDARYLYRTDTAVTFTAELTDWQQERIRSCTEEYRDVTHSELVDAIYSGSGWETISREEWEHLEEEFLKDKEFITADFAWDRLWTYTYEELAENALTDKELGEALEALYISWQDSTVENEANEAKDLYDKFLNGEQCVGDMDIYYFITPIGEPDRRYAADYIIMDSTGDGIPELHLRTAREYTIFSYVDDELVIIQSFFSSPWLYNVTKNGAFIYREDTGTTLGNYYLYFEMDIYGNFCNEVTFEWTDINENFICDENDEFIFDNRPCTKEEWCEQTREYLFIDEEGRYQIRDQVEWIRYCE